LKLFLEVVHVDWSEFIKKNGEGSNFNLKTQINKKSKNLF